MRKALLEQRRIERSGDIRKRLADAQSGKRKNIGSRNRDFDDLDEDLPPARPSHRVVSDSEPEAILLTRETTKPPEKVRKRQERKVHRADFRRKAGDTTKRAISNTVRTGAEIARAGAISLIKHRDAFKKNVGSRVSPWNVV